MSQIERICKDVLMLIRFNHSLLFRNYMVPLQRGIDILIKHCIEKISTSRQTKPSFTLKIDSFAEMILQSCMTNMYQFIRHYQTTSE